MQYSISAAAFVAIIILIRLRRRTEARSRGDEAFTVFSSIVLGVLIAGTAWGHAILQLVGVVTRATH
ncbi:hypothetical protein ACIQ9P_08650 [Kitasatospora sp. NPDC094019]|uniref:hypothetical protein n=1 Tax=Kitasatospora sp. NPDC094019 TaxID=3364091 RepID=UPI00381C84A3